MTSEVVVLNKQGVVIAADSAVTSSGSGKHPRYSKTANKIFDVSPYGNVAVTIFANAAIDGVPWEVTFKEFRAKQAGLPQLDGLEDYVVAIREFLTGNSRLFPVAHLSEVKARLLSLAAANILKRVTKLSPAFVDESKPIAERVSAWTQATAELRTHFSTMSVNECLTVDAFEATLATVHKLAAEIQAELSTTKLSSIIVSPQTLAELAVAVLYKDPTSFLQYTGLVVSGYGTHEIFPSYRTIHVYGHVGMELLVDIPENRGPDYAGKTITHNDGAWIRAFAQSSMIDVFTDGFGFSLHKIIKEKSRAALLSLVKGLVEAGIVIAEDISRPIVDASLAQFENEWTTKNYAENFAPLISVLAGMSVLEMSELAETLLTLESVKERVTSPSESVGGPIDIAVITKAEGLVWVKRKHFFPAELNLRYSKRSGMA